MDKGVEMVNIGRFGVFLAERQRGRDHNGV